MNELRELRKLYWWSFTLRFGVGVAALIASRVLDLALLQDALFYDEVAQGVAADWLAGHSSAWLTQAMAGGTQAWVNVVLIACIYWLTGGIRITVLVLALYALVTSYTPVLIYRITRRLGGTPVAARFAGRLVAFSPCFAFWSGALYKEGIVLVLLAMGVLQTLRLQERLRLTSLATVTLCVTLLFGVRFYMAVILAVALAYGLLMGRPRTDRVGAQWAAVVRQVVVVFAFATLLVGLGFTSRVQRTLPADLSEVLVSMDVSRSDLARSGQSGYLPNADVSTVPQALRFMPVGVLYFVTVPWPWQVGSARQNITLPETAFWVLILYPLMGLGVVQALRRNFQGSSLLVIMGLAICSFYALLVGNIGTAYRLRIQVWLLGAVFAGLGWQRWKELRAQRVVRTARLPARGNHAVTGTR